MDRKRRLIYFSYLCTVKRQNGVNLFRYGFVPLAQPRLFVILVEVYFGDAFLMEHFVFKRLVSFSSLLLPNRE